MGGGRSGKVSGEKEKVGVSRGLGVGGESLRIWGKCWAPGLSFPWSGPRRSGQGREGVPALSPVPDVGLPPHDPHPILCKLGEPLVCRPDILVGKQRPAGGSRGPRVTGGLFHGKERGQPSPARGPGSQSRGGALPASAAFSRSFVLLFRFKC